MQDISLDPSEFYAHVPGLFIQCIGYTLTLRCIWTSTSYKLLGVTDNQISSHHSRYINVRSPLGTTYYWITIPGPSGPKLHGLGLVTLFVGYTFIGILTCTDTWSWITGGYWYSGCKSLFSYLFIYFVSHIIYIYIFFSEIWNFSSPHLSTCMFEGGIKNELFWK